ncbi:MAG: hypothetical protein WDZ59_16605 [Pirellulales bacterium]
MNRTLGTMLLLAAALAVVGGSSAQAQDPCCGGAYYGYGFGVNRFYQSNRQIPYFALHPPVYYSYPVPRTYGYSPFAYPPTVMTPEVEPEPLTVENTFLPQPAQPEEEATDRSTESTRKPEPLVVFNPYVESSAPLAEAAAAR